MNKEFYNKLSDEFKSKYPLREQEEKSLYEGLIYSYGIDYTVRHLNETLSSTNNIYFKQFDNENRYYLFIKDGKIDYKQLKWVISESDICGWFPSIYKIGNTTKKFTSVGDLLDNLNKNEDINVTFDAKYDIELFINDFKGNYVYHVSPINKKEKILKLGLSPKSNNKTANYSSRIYLTYNINGIDRLLGAPNFHSDSTEFVVFKVKIKELLKRRIIRFFEDPAYAGFGFYTYENIPPEYIEIEKELKQI